MSYIAAISLNKDFDFEDADDMKYILQAALDGRLESAEGFKSATGDLCTLTVASGKDLYLSAAKVTFFVNATGATSSIGDEVVLKINGSIVETVKFSSLQSSVDGGVGSFSYEFRNIGHKVAYSVGTETIKLEVIALDTQTDVEGFVQAIEVPTGENPTTYTGA